MSIVINRNGLGENPGLNVCNVVHNDQKKSVRQVISSQITKDSASTSSAHGFVLFSG